MSDLGHTGAGGAGPDGGDALTVLSWGLRHYWWAIVLSVCALGVAVPLLLDRAPDTYEAEAQVGPAGALNLQSIDPLPRVGQSLFNNGSVAEAVRGSFDPPLPRSEDVIPNRVSLITAQDNLVLTVVGTASTPRTAAGLANVAAETLADELNRYEGSVGLFTVQRRAVPPSRSVQRLGLASSVGVGVAAGLVVGLGIVGLLLVRRRPVLSAESAEAATGAPVLGSVWLGRTPAEARGLPQFCHAISMSACKEMLLAGPSRTKPHRHQLTLLLTQVLAGRREVISDGGLSRDQLGARLKGSPGERLLVVEDASQAQLATRTDRSIAVLVVPHGIGRASLVRQVQQYLDEGGTSGLVMVQGAGYRRRLGRRRVTSPVDGPGTTLTPTNGAPSTGNWSSPRATSTRKSRTNRRG